MDGSVALEFMTDDQAEAEEMREQMLAVEGVAEVNIVDLLGWVALPTAADSLTPSRRGKRAVTKEIACAIHNPKTAKNGDRAPYQ